MLTQPRTWGSNRSHAGVICFFKQNIFLKKSLKPESQMLRGVVYRLTECLASMGHSSIWKRICAISVSNILTVGVHLSSTPSISGPGSATVLICEGTKTKPDVNCFFFCFFFVFFLNLFFLSSYFICNHLQSHIYIHTISELTNMVLNFLVMYSLTSFLPSFFNYFKLCYTICLLII